MHRLLILFFVFCSVTVEAAVSVKFFYPFGIGGPLTCNGGPAVGNQVPFECMFSDQGKLVISLENWGWEGKAILTLDDPGSTITGFCAGSVTPDPNLPQAYQLNPDCLAGNGPPPAATGELLFDEWYADLPWNQKLSTKDSNLINAPFVLPFAALPKAYRESPACANDEARCMLRYGIVNVMAMHRSDRRYEKEQTEALTKKDCENGQCVEVKLEIHRFHTLADNEDGYEADEIRNNKRVYTDHNGKSKEVPSLGFAVTEATIFAPWRPWYTGHYCALYQDNIADAVCYEDYFTTQLIAPTPFQKSWLKDAPAFFWQRGAEPGFNTFCKSGEKACSMYLGKVDWLQNVDEAEVIACDQPPPPASLQTCQQEVRDRTARLDEQFNVAITGFTDEGRYPWRESMITDLAKDIAYNPFIGFYQLERNQVNKDTGLFLFKSPHYALPKECSKSDYKDARYGDETGIQRLSECVMNFEIHTSGFHELWKELYGGMLPLSDAAVAEISKAIPGTDANQYGRTMFMYAGVREQHVPVSFKFLPGMYDEDNNVLVDAMSIYDKVYNGSIYIQYLPMINPGDLSLFSKSYTDDFWHAFFMSNHMNQTPDHFIRGIRGRTLWHNEYRSNLMYKAAVEVDNQNKRSIDGTAFETVLEHVDFPAGFQADMSSDLAPFHGNTCDSCHIRNGSGIPLMANEQLPQLHVNHGMNADYQIHRDYTYSNKELPPMKMVLFDLREYDGLRENCDDDNHTVPEDTDLEPLIPSFGERRGYANKIMNFYGNSLHLNQNNNKLEYKMEYVDTCGNDGFEVVDKTLRDPVDTNQYSSCQAVNGQWARYQPKAIKIDTAQIKSGDVCQGIADNTLGVSSNRWPGSCADVSGDAINAAIANGEIGFMHLLGRRLGNTPLIEMIPDATIQGIRLQQTLNEKFSVPGCISLAPGTRSGKKGEMNYRSCSSGKLGKGGIDCYIGRWGWVGDRASLEDQIANAAHMEMNVTSTKSYVDAHPNPNDEDELVRYQKTLCGPANASCRALPANSDISEQEIRDMATYQRWIGIPNRSEYQVSSEQVQQGEKLFNQLQCRSCHVIKKIAFDYNDNMLPDEEREHLQKLAIAAEGIPVLSGLSSLFNADLFGGVLSQAFGNFANLSGANGSLFGALGGIQPALDYPFISYLGTDLLLHDMGYLSQVAHAPPGVSIRNADGSIKWRYRNYVQKIRTPALKGLRFNRFVTDSNHNTSGATVPLQNNFTPGCDFLLHDGRACDAIEAAYLHDGPAIKSLNMIQALNALAAEELEQLRAFLYSL